ncbi:MAG: hypothetical protein V4598_15665 [Bdellovibrionota bacterium]
MKILIFSLILSFQAGASTIAKYRSTPDGSAMQKFNLESDKATYEKTSNLFDLKAKNYSVGLHDLKAVTKEYSAVMKEVDEYAKKFQVVDEFLKEKGSGFNQVSGIIQHEAVILVDDFRVKPDSKHYAALNKLFQRLQKLDWKLAKGFQISPDLQKVMEFENGKPVKTEKYARDLYCKKAQLPTVCTLHGGGQIYVE